MNRERILEAMEYIDPVLIESADRPLKKVRRGGWLRIAVIAACLCLVLAGTAVAWNSSRVRITWVDEESEEWLKENNVAYTIDHDYAYFPLDCFSDEVTEFTEELAHKLKGWAFKSHDKLEKFLGLEIWDNPVLDAAVPGPTTSLSGMKDKPTHILLMASYNGKGALSISTDASYVVDSIWVKADTQLYTDLMREDVETIAEYGGKPGPGIVTLGDYRIEADMEEVYTAASGLEATITRSVSAAKGAQQEIVSYLAHFDVNGIRFDVYARPYPVGVMWAEYEDDPAHTLEVLKEVLDGFVFES